MKLSLVIPCYNEEQNVALFYKETATVFNSAGVSCEMVFVNDGSTDKTLDILKKLCVGPFPIQVISFSRNFGKEAAMLAGLRAARGDYVCVIDADLQQRPEIALGMVRTLDSDENLDCVAAYQEKRDEGKLISVCKDGFYGIINKFSDTEFVRGASDFRCFRRRMVDSIVNLNEYHRFSKGLFSWVGYKTLYIPYRVEERATGESKWSFKKLVRYAVDGIESFTTAPLKLPFVLGILFIILSVLFLIVSLVAHRSLAVTAVFFVGGCILACLGIMGDYIAKVFVQSKDRPLYIIKEKYSNKR